MSLYDISPLLTPELAVWPGDKSFSRELTMSISGGAAVNVSAITLSTHSGCHVDAPYHFLDAARTVDELPLEPFVGPALLVDAEGASAVGLPQIAPIGEKAVERLLVRTRRKSDPYHFDEAYAALLPEAAQRLVENGLRLYGTDAPSIDPFDSKTLESHKILAGGGVMILEGLCLDEPSPGEYELIALPLRLAGADASPVRAILRGPIRPAVL